MKILPGNAINRQYRNAKNLRNKGWALMGASTALAAITAKNKDVPLTVINAGAIFVCGKGVESTINKMRSLKTDYNKIIERTLRIKNK